VRSLIAAIRKGPPGDVWRIAGAAPATVAPGTLAPAGDAA
jgi:hypothetical protein